MGRATKSDKWQPTPKQLAVIEAAMDGGFGRSVTAICLQAGVSRPTFYEWMKEDEGFQKTWDELPNKLLRPSIPGVIQAMITKAKAGDVQAARLLLEMAHVYTPPTQRHEHSGPNGKPIETVTKIDWASVPDDELQQYHACLAKLRSRAGTATLGSGNGAVPPQAN